MDRVGLGEPRGGEHQKSVACVHQLEPPVRSLGRRLESELAATTAPERPRPDVDGTAVTQDVDHLGSRLDPHVWQFRLRVTVLVGGEEIG